MNNLNWEVESGYMDSGLEGSRACPDPDLIEAALEVEAERRRLAEAEEETKARLVEFNAVGNFLFAGKACVTLKSRKTGAHYTYKVAHKKDGDVSFVSLLVGPSNETDYRYLGLLPDNDTTRLRGVGRGKSCAGPDAPSAKAFQYLLDFIWGKTKGEGLEVWHEGRCGRCGRKLTVPESIESGIGPECATKM